MKSYAQYVNDRATMEYGIDSSASDDGLANDLINEYKAFYVDYSVYAKCYK